MRSGSSIAIGALLVVAVLPVARDVLRPGEQALPVSAGARLITELENRRALAEADLPFWNPRQFGGRPHLANPETRVLYPPDGLTRLLPIDIYLPVSFVLHAWLLGIGGYLVGRQLGAPRGAAFAVAMAMLLATLLVPTPGLRYSSEIYTFAWIPLAQACAMRSTERRGSWPGAGLVLTLVMALLAGSVRGVIYVIAAVVAWYVFAILWARSAADRGRHLIQLASVLGLTAGLTAFHTLPAAQLLISAAGSDRPIAHEPREDAALPAGSDRQLDASLVNALLPLRSGRTFSVCASRIGEHHLAAHGIVSAGGVGRLLSSRYSEFIELAQPARIDLLNLLDVEYLVACDPPDARRWLPVGTAYGAAIYRNTEPLGRAVWTCAPRAVSRSELEYSLRRQRYDRTLTLRSMHMINVRWAPGVDDGERRRAEIEFGIAPERYLEDRTWRYGLLDASSVNVAAIVTSPAVEDTAGVDRASFEPIPAKPPVFEGEPRTEWLLGAEPCVEPTRATVSASDRADGRVVVDVLAPRDGLVFFSETFDPDRLAFVDGRQVEPLRVNLTFTGVPVTSGQHRVELTYDLSAFRLGAMISACSLIAWSILVSRTRS